MKGFINSEVGRYVLLDESFCVKDLILKDSEIDKLRIAFHKVAIRHEKQTTKKKKRVILTENE